jgi:hypothetical protein
MYLPFGLNAATLHPPERLQVVLPFDRSRASSNVIRPSSRATATWSPIAADVHVPHDPLQPGTSTAYLAVRHV